MDDATTEITVTRRRTIEEAVRLKVQFPIYRREYADDYDRPGCSTTVETLMRIDANLNMLQIIETRHRFQGETRSEWGVSKMVIGKAGLVAWLDDPSTRCARYEFYDALEKAKAFLRPDWEAERPWRAQQSLFVRDKIEVDGMGTFYVVDGSYAVGDVVKIAGVMRKVVEIVAADMHGRGTGLLTLPL